MRLIDADALAELLKREAEHHEADGLMDRSYGVLDAYMDVISTPPVDAVPVIRCKYCVHNGLPPKAGNALCSIYNGMTEVYGFCHRGERREEDEVD